MKELDKKSSEKLLAESQNYYIIGSYEEASLYRKSDDKYVGSVGHHYGDPTDALIDWKVFWKRTL